jgi:hypothetical protein
VDEEPDRAEAGVKHSPDCALIQYADIPPAQLKRPLECDGVECEGAEDLPDVPVDDDNEPIASVHPISSGGVTLTGDEARAYRALKAAETALKAAQKRKDDALTAFLEAATR